MAGTSGLKQLTMIELIALNYISIICINDAFFCKHTKYEETFTVCSVLTDYMMTPCVILIQNDIDREGTRIV